MDRLRGLKIVGGVFASLGTLLLIGSVLLLLLKVAAGTGMGYSWPLIVQAVLLLLVSGLTQLGFGLMLRAIALLGETSQAQLQALHRIHHALSRPDDPGPLEQ